MSSNELIAEILALSSGLESFSNFQVLNIGQSNSLFSVAPQLDQFISSCGSELNQLLQLSESSVFNQLIETNLDLAGSLSPCLEQLLGLEQLFSSGTDVQLSNNGNNGNNDVNNSNVTAVSNSTDSVSSASNSTAAAASNSTEAASAQQGNDGKKGEAKGNEKKKNGKRGEVVQRSSASKRRVLGGLGLGLMVVVGAFAL